MVSYKGGKGIKIVSFFSYHSEEFFILRTQNWNSSYVKKLNINFNNIEYWNLSINGYTNFIDKLQ